MNKTDIKSLSAEQIKQELQRFSVPGFHAKQIFKWLYRGVDSFEEMTDLPLKLRSRLSDAFYIEKPEEIDSITSKQDGTTKYLFTLSDGEYCESVLLRYNHGNSACLSTQVGCKMGCKFCASTKAGFTRNMTVSEMLNQIDFIQRDKRQTEPDFRINHVVLMGIGEPLDNYDNVIKFLRLINDPDGFGISMRNISLSTCGVADKIKELENENLQLTLSVSLHAPNNELRSSLMPINKLFPIEELLAACRHYTDKTGRRISFEYALISGVNDTPECAKQLARLLRGMLCHVNLIPVNEIKENTFSRSTKEAQKVFTNILSDSRINVTTRRRLGDDIDAACGQLRREKLEKSRF